jgi:hypothetical protein
MADMLLFYILQNINKLKIVKFSKIYYQTSFEHQFKWH